MPMDRDDALDYRMLYGKSVAEIERLRAALREIAEWPAIGSRPLTIALKALSPYGQAANK